jgi:hypothetical protein
MRPCGPAKSLFPKKSAQICKKAVDPAFGIATFSVPQRPGLLKSSGSFTDISVPNDEFGLPRAVEIWPAGAKDHTIFETLNLK